MPKWRIPYPLVEVIWNDAASNSESWVHLDDIIKPEQVNTTGFLVKETPEALTVAASVSNQPEFIETVGNTMTIPRGMIVTWRKIKIASIKPRNKLRTKPDTKEVHREPGKS